MSTTAIISLVGEAWIRSQDGSLREANLGSSIAEGETIITGENARVVLDFGGGMDTALINGGTEINIPIGEGSASDESLEEGQVERLMALLGNTDGDIQDQLAPPSSGSRSDGNADNGHSFVRLLRIVEELTPLKYQFDLRGEEELEPRGGIADLADDNPAAVDLDVSLSGVAPPGTFAGPAGNSPGGEGTGSASGANGALPPAAQWAQLVVGEAGLPGGSADDGKGISQSGVFGFSSPDGLAELTFGDSLVLSLADLRGLEAAPLAVVTDHGTVWLDGFTGDAAGGEVSYHFELESAVDNDRQPGASDGGYVEQVAVAVTDVDGSHASGSLGILIVDDIPTNQVQGPVNVVEGESVVGTWSREAGADGEDTTVVFVIGDDTPYALGTLIATPGGMLLVNQDGSWSFDAAPGGAGGEDLMFRLVTTDMDGDRADTTHRVRITPDTGPVTPDSDGDASTLPVATTLDEDGLPGGIAGGKGDAPGEAVV
ncbi:retention module-containing protein, partial [Halomonas sp. V046]|uniref:retention module-containing protein n=1 Tax=Halomonas sp. V046 TaxID=3459611 RepID=UPI004044AAF0